MRSSEPPYAKAFFTTDYRSTRIRSPNHFLIRVLCVIRGKKGLEDRGLPDLPLAPTAGLWGNDGSMIAPETFNHIENIKKRAGHLWRFL